MCPVLDASEDGEVGVRDGARGESKYLLVVIEHGVAATCVYVRVGARGRASLGPNGCRVCCERKRGPAKYGGRSVFTGVQGSDGSCVDA